jgi:hypothetical protein
MADIIEFDAGAALGDMAATLRGMEEVGVRPQVIADMLTGFVELLDDTGATDVEVVFLMSVLNKQYDEAFGR